MDILGENTTATLVCLGGLILIIGILLMRTQQYYAQHRSVRPSMTAPSRSHLHEHGHHLDTLVGSAAAWEVEMHEVARRLSGQLDSKMSALEELIREADRAAARLEAVIATLPQPSPPGEHPEGPNAAPPAAASASPLPAEDATPSIDQAEASSDVEDEASPEPSPGPQKTRQRRHEEIYTLADYGLDAVEIARRTSHPVGEIQLILALRHPKSS